MANRKKYAWIVGPDGCGKSTITSELTYYENTIVKYWRPGLLPMPGKFPGFQYEVELNAQPHLRPTDRAFKSTMRLMYYFADYLLGDLFYIKLKKNSGVILYERGWLDMFVDPKRYGLKKSKKVLALFKFLAKPKYIFVITADAKKIMQRKSELSTEEIERQYSEWNNMRFKKTRVIKIDNNEKMQSAVDTIVKILDYSSNQK